VETSVGPCVVDRRRIGAMRRGCFVVVTAHWAGVAEWSFGCPPKSPSAGLVVWWVACGDWRFSRTLAMGGLQVWVAGGGMG
jgi:hypothetical protein